MSEAMETAWAAFRSETPTNNQPMMRKAFHAGWDAAQAISLPDRETLAVAIDVLRGYGHDAIGDALAALSTQPAAGEVAKTVWHKDQFWVNIETDAHGQVTISDELLVKLMTESGWVLQP